LFTRALTPSEYGQLSIAVSIAGAASILFAAGLNASVIRDHFQLADDPSAQSRHAQTLWTALLVGPLVIAVLVSLAAAPILSGSTVITPVAFGLALVIAALNVAGSTVPLQLLRAERRTRAFVAIDLTFSLATIGGTVLLVIVLGLGTTAWLAALVAANALTLVVALWIVPYRPRAGFDRRMLMRSLRFSLPLVPHFVSQWALRVADQLALTTLVSIGLVGVYSLAASIAAPVLMLVSSLQQGFMPSYGEAGKVTDRQGDLRAIIALQVSIVAWITLAAATAGPTVIHLLASPRYARAADLAPWLILGYGLLGAFYIPMGIAVLVHGRTKGVAFITMTAAAVNIAGVFVLEPIFGLAGAAAATPVGYAVLLVGILLYVRVVGTHISVPWARIWRAVGICVVAYVGIQAVPAGTYSWRSLLIRSLLVFGAGGCLAALSSSVRSWVLGKLSMVRGASGRVSLDP
jgi:O-antigen/teichoic acid export membrane protein